MGLTPRYGAAPPLWLCPPRYGAELSAMGLNPCYGAAPPPMAPSPPLWVRPPRYGAKLSAMGLKLPLWV